MQDSVISSANELYQFWERADNQRRECGDGTCAKMMCVHNSTVFLFFFFFAMHSATSNIQIMEPILFIMS